MMLTEGDFFWERKVCFKTLLCCTPEIRPMAKPLRPQQSRVSLEQGSKRRDLFGKE